MRFTSSACPGCAHSWVCPVQWLKEMSCHYLWRANALRENDSALFSRVSTKLFTKFQRVIFLASLWPALACYLWVRRKELDLTLNYKAEFVWLTVKEKQSKPSILYIYLTGSGDTMSMEPTDFNWRDTSGFLKSWLWSLKTTATWETQNQRLYI